MRPIDASRLIELSESGARLGNAARALLLLESQGLEADTAQALTLGGRDRILMRVREVLFGPRMTAQERCYACGEPYEVILTAEDVGLGDGGAEDRPIACTLQADGRDYTVRALTAGDMAMAESAAGADAARALLLARVAPGAPDSEAPRIAEALEQLDPLAHVSVVMPCPACGKENELSLDVPAFLWREIEYRVPRLLDQVAELARVFHWSEHDILAMPQSRRSFYLAAAGR
jgi:hypothetical protein